MPEFNPNSVLQSYLLHLSDAMYAVIVNLLGLTVTTTKNFQLFFYSQIFHLLWQVFNFCGKKEIINHHLSLLLSQLAKPEQKISNWPHLLLMWVIHLQRPLITKKTVFQTCHAKQRYLADFFFCILSYQYSTRQWGGEGEGGTKSLDPGPWM